VGQRAKHAAYDLAFGKDVTLLTHGLDKYGRTLADVLLSDGTNVNYMLVKDGWCWWYQKYAPGDTTLEGLEKDAREAKKGLWVDPAASAAVGVEKENSVRPPREWRRGRGTIRDDQGPLFARIRLTARLPCPSRFASSVAFPCNARLRQEAFS